MAVVLDATGTVATTTPTLVPSPINYTGITVGAGSNRALLATIAFPGVGSGVAPTGTTVVWDQGGTNQVMTLIGAMTNNQGCYIAFYGLLNPTSGNKTMQVAWTGGFSTATSTICAISFTGVIQSSVAAAFPNQLTATGTSATPTITVTSATGHMSVAATAVDVTASTLGSENHTRLYVDTNSSQDNGAQYSTGAATVSFTWSAGSSVTWDAIGTDVAPTAQVGTATSGGAVHEGPVRFTRKVFHQSIAQPIFIKPVAPTFVGWPAWSNPVYPLIKAESVPTQFTAVITTAAVNLGWLTEWVDLVRRPPVNLGPATGLTVVPLAATPPTTWFAPLSEPMRRKPSAIPQVSADAPRFDASKVVIVEGLSEPVRQRQQINRGPFAAQNPLPLPNNTVPPNGWLGWSTPVYPLTKAESVPAGFVAQNNPATATPTGWLAPWVDLVRRLPIANLGPFGAFEALPIPNPNVTPPNGWTAWSTPVLPKVVVGSVPVDFLASPGAGSATIIMSWDRWPDFTTRKKRTAQYQDETFVAVPPTATVIQDWPEILARKRPPLFVQPPFVPVVTAPVVAPPTAWFAPLSEPTRRKPFNLGQVDATEALPQPNPIVTSWLAELPDVIRRKPAINLGPFTAFNPLPLPNPPVSIGWYASLSSPVWPKKGMPKELQRFEELDPFARPPGNVILISLQDDASWQRMQVNSY